MLKSNELIAAHVYRVKCVMACTAGPGTPIQETQVAWWTTAGSLFSGPRLTSSQYLLMLRPLTTLQPLVDGA